jgi:hypothetical protein
MFVKQQQQHIPCMFLQQGEPLPNRQATSETANCQCQRPGFAVRHCRSLAGPNPRGLSLDVSAAGKINDK